jgi:hypothetical protein
VTRITISKTRQIEKSRRQFQTNQITKDRIRKKIVIKKMEMKIKIKNKLENIQKFNLRVKLKK